MRWNVIYAGERHPLDVSSEDSIEVFKLQIFSLLDIPPESLSIQGVSPSALSADSAPLATLNLPDDADVIIQSTNTPTEATTSPAKGDVPTASIPVSSPSPAPAIFRSTSQLARAGLAPSQPSASVPGPAPTGYDMDEALARRLQLEEDASIAAQLAQADRRQQMQPPMHLLQRQMQQGAAGLGQLQGYLTYVSRVQSYEDPKLQAQARALIPIAELERRARERVESALLVRPEPSSSHEQDGPLSFRDALLRELLHWFKGWFRWANITCERCQHTTESAGMGDPTPLDLADGATRVELHRCPACRHVTRFPRYNEPSRLLQTRMGRCGEWANAFTLCCRSLGFEARLVLDPTDHVWTEAYSEDKGRWLHLDPCEDVFDRPHLYEAGWGKKLSYVVGISRDGLADVSRRYSTDWAATTARRRAFADESTAARILADATTSLRTLLPPLRRQLLSTRDNEEEWELAERVKPGQGGGGAGAGTGVAELGGGGVGGRSTGDIAWRAARGEMGPAAPGGGHTDVSGVKEDPVDDVVADISSAVLHVCALALMPAGRNNSNSHSNSDATYSDRQQLASGPNGRPPAGASHAAGAADVSATTVASISSPPPSAVEVLRALMRVLTEVVSRPKALLPLDLGRLLVEEPGRGPQASAGAGNGDTAGQTDNINSDVSGWRNDGRNGVQEDPALVSQLRLIARAPSAVSLLRGAGCKFSLPAAGPTTPISPLPSATARDGVLASPPIASRGVASHTDTSSSPPQTKAVLSPGPSAPSADAAAASASLPSASASMLRGGVASGPGSVPVVSGTARGGTAANPGMASVESDASPVYPWLSTRHVGHVKCARIMVRAALPDVAGTARRSAQLAAAGAGPAARGGWVCASAENPPHERAINAFDGRLDTKWLGKLDNKGSAWLQYRWKGEQSAAPGPARIVSHYRLTSANDAPERDPSSWVLEGSVDGGKNWELIDARGPVSFRDRFTASELFLVAEARRRPYKSIRLRITAIRDRSATDLTQLCMLELFHPLAPASPPPAALPPTSTPAAAAAPVVDPKAAWQAKFKETVATQFATLVASGKSANEAAALAMKAATEICGRPPS
eukprot:jgi/Mesvir1/7964/Mv11875-RA.2